MRAYSLASALLVAASSAAIATPKPSYPPSLAQLSAADRKQIARDLMTKSGARLDSARVDAFGDVTLATTDPALVTQRQDHGAFEASDLAHLEKYVAANAAALHVHDLAAIHFAPVPHETAVQLVEHSAEGMTTLTIMRSWYDGSDKQVHAILTSRLRREAPAMPDTTKTAAALRALLVGKPFDRVEHFNAHPCDPVGPVDTCPKAYDDRKRITIRAADVTIAFGAIELVRKPGGPLETHLVGCAMLVGPGALQGSWRDSYASTGVHFEPVGSALPLPRVLDVISGEDLTNQLHAHGGIGCGSQVTGAGYDASDIDDR